MNLYNHLKERGMNPDLYDCHLDDDLGVATFMLYDLSGRLVGYQKYRPTGDKTRSNAENGRYFTYCPEKTTAVFGLELLDPTDRTLYVTEGIFKAAVLHRLGYNAIAVLTSTPKPMRQWFWLLGKRYNLQAVGDGDSAGAALVRMVGKGFCSPVDLDEMKDEDIEELLWQQSRKRTNTS